MEYLDQPCCLIESIFVKLVDFMEYFQIILIIMIVNLYITIRSLPVRGVRLPQNLREMLECEQIVKYTTFEKCRHLIN